MLERSDSVVPSACVLDAAEGIAPIAGRLSDQMVLAAKLMGQAKTRLMPHVPGVDGAGYVILFQLVSQPRRVSELAELLHSDVSTVSRQVSALTKRGLADKTPDPDDRRSQLVSATEDGRRLVSERIEQRRAVFSEVFADWDPADVQTLFDLLERLTHDMSQLVSGVVAHH